MGKRHHTGDVAGGSEAKRPRQSAAAGHKNLYLALDDWNNGYSIHKHVDPVGSTTAPEPLPDPPLLRLEAPRGCHDVLFGAAGSKILALWQPRNKPTRAAAFDTRTGGLLADGPEHPPGLQPMRFVAAGAGARPHAVHAGGVHCLDLDEAAAPAPGADRAYCSYAAAEKADARRWRWTRACSSPLRLPFVADDGAPAPWGPAEIAAYAVHSDGRTVFVSAFGTFYRYFGTFSLDTAASRPEWARHGEWLLPFRGQGHYDSTLDAWVGLHSPGYMCACDVPPAGAGAGERPRPEWELVKADGLFVTDPEDSVLRQSFMTLAGMGDGEFCILEPHTTDGGDVTRDMDTGDEYVLHVTKFRLQRSRRGPLRVSSRHIARSAYRLHKYDRNFAPRAFCM